MEFDRRGLLKRALAGAGAVGAAQGLGAGLAPSWIAGAAAQEAWPSRPVHVFIGFAPGSGADVLCRYFTSKMQDTLGKTVVPENRPGAVGSIAINLAAKSKPDGHSVLFTGNTLLVAGRHLLKDFTIDYRQDLMCCSGLFETPFVLAVGAKSPAKDVQDLIRRLKAKPQNKYGYTNPAAMVAGYAFKAFAGAQAEGVSYRTTAEAVGDLESNMLDYQIMDGTFAGGQAKAGKLRILAATTEKRVSALPDVPTMGEQDVPDFEFSPWWAVWLPAGSPKPVAEKLGALVTEIGKRPETEKFLEGIVAMPVIGDPAYVLQRLDADRKRWDKLAAAAGITPQ
ncbi:MAG TPA: tripartite tricarboxylate transporter substrate binding protein, partial [Beijerinckiaceae bacterium]|jgi:tripartite-type tricarboxylate transporter receptor subunit TctC